MSTSRPKRKVSRSRVPREAEAGPFPVVTVEDELRVLTLAAHALLGRCVLMLGGDVPCSGDEIVRTILSAEEWARSARRLANAADDAACGLLAGRAC